MTEADARLEAVRRALGITPETKFSNARFSLIGAVIDIEQMDGKVDRACIKVFDSVLRQLRDVELALTGTVPPSTIGESQLNETESEQDLKPCPFCDDGQTMVVWHGLSKVEVRHWCPQTANQRSPTMLTFVGHDRASAIAAWNRRVASQRSKERLDNLIRQAHDCYLRVLKGKQLSVMDMGSLVESLEALNKDLNG